MRDRWVSFWLALLLGFVYLLTHSWMYHSVDEMSVVSAAKTVLAGDGWHANQMEWEQSWRKSQTMTGLDGNLYLNKRGLAVAALILPWLAAASLWKTVGAVQLALLTGPLVTALTGVVLYRTARRLKFDVGAAALTVLAWGLGTLAWPYSRTLFTEPTAALGLSLALYGAVTFRRASGGAAMRALLVAGCGLALLTLAKQANAVVVLPFAAYLVYVAFAERRAELTWKRLAGWILAFGIPLVIAAAAVVAYNRSAFGTLLTPPLDYREGFKTPLITGLRGLLFSSGKGVLWHVPLAWLALVSAFFWRRGKRLPDFLLAFGTVLSLLLLYSAWSDWAGGRSWGPRFLATVMPAVALMALPALEGLLSRAWPLPARLAVGAVLLLSVVMQLPGVLINFTAQEALDIDAGLTTRLLYWMRPHSPLLTYWRAIGSPTTDSLLGQKALWGEHPARMAGLLALGILGIAAAGAGLRRAVAGRKTAVLGVAGLVAASALAFGLLATAAADSRWQEASADPAENRDVLAFIEAHATPADLVLLDIIPYYDMIGRTWLWLNRAPARPQFVGWLRREQMQPAHVERLQAWLQPYGRAWLSLEGTAPGAAESTTEAWLDGYGYRGNDAWVGTQRVVEYVIAPLSADAAVIPADIRFSGGPTLTGYAVQRGKAPGLVAVRLLWDAPVAENLRFSVQAVDPTGKPLAGIDRRPGALATPAGYEDRVGLAVGTDDYALALRVYDSADGKVLPVTGAVGGDHIALPLQDGAP
jgi:hypothetical protein